MLEAAVKHGIDLSNLWGSIESDGKAVREACLLVPGAGRTVVVFMSCPREDDTERIDELGSVLDAAIQHVSPGAAIAQSILGLEETGPRHALEAAEFLCAGTLRYMRRPATPVEAPPSLDSGWPEGITVERVDPTDDSELAVALERSYEQTLDCPELCGLRDIGDIISSHRATGEWDPELWWLVRDGGEPTGAALFNPCPEQKHSELVYMGLAPESRGRGVASRLLDFGLHETLSRWAHPITCAVDERNIPAQKLYERTGFSLFERRIAFVRPIA